MLHLRPKKGLKDISTKVQNGNTIGDWDSPAKFQRQYFKGAPKGNKIVWCAELGHLDSKLQEFWMCWSVLVLFYVLIQKLTFLWRFFHWTILVRLFYLLWMRSAIFAINWQLNRWWSNWLTDGNTEELWANEEVNGKDLAIATRIRTMPSADAFFLSDGSPAYKKYLRFSEVYALTDKFVVLTK